MRILLAEDDANISSHVADTLKAEGYEVVTLQDGPEVLEAGEEPRFSAIILDLGLPGLDGLSILRRWRRDHIETPVLVLTARSSWMERVDGFDAGADDYLPKPFRTEELLARLRALLRRAGKRSQPIRSSSRFQVDETSRLVSFDGQSLDVSPLEFRLIQLLVENKGRVFSAYEIASQIQGRDDDASKNAVEAMVARIRKKTDPDAIATRRGFGYYIPDDA
ncbi:response regulator transcription factor [Allorhizobium sp. BGMRC 0089]|uniref:response regulator transcription factor n=1 Tax=Allorhizobium sonneratiae TaxID=2934936 RepID=UPI00203356C4|nr:response regulator transcription factor [Allorhizobium sonneratiae]MCM2291676.1 response regulator transcription factor [Allorhizobium sonneratiae]